MSVGSALPQVLCIVGPTASGKTEVAFELSKKIPIEVISCDSMQVYKRMPILSQSPPKNLQKKMKIHLVNFLEPEKEFNAALFRELTEKLIPKILKKGKAPVIVGGTGLYLRALLDGLFESSESKLQKDEAFRQKMLAAHEKHGSHYLHDQLKTVDEAAAQKIHPNDIRRIVRALEVYHLTGKPMSEQKSNRNGIRNQYDLKIFFLDRDREDLYERIESRVDQMLKDGLIREVKRLEKRSLSQTASMALGFREIKSYLAKEKTLEEALGLLKMNTRRYAKRQISWFRHEKGVEFLEVKKKEPLKIIAKKILAGKRQTVS